MERGIGFEGRQGFATGNNTCAGQATTINRSAEVVTAARLRVHRVFFASVFLLHSRSSSPSESGRALKAEVPCRAVTEVHAFRGVFGHRESSCHLGKQDSTIRLGLGLINWNQHESEFSSSGSQSQRLVPQDKLRVHSSSFLSK